MSVSKKKWKTDVEWGDFSELEETIVDSIHWIETQYIDWDQRYDQ